MKEDTNVSYLLSIIGGPWQKGGHMKHDFSSMELRIHRMLTSGVICQSNFQMSGKFRKWVPGTHALESTACHNQWNEIEYDLGNNLSLKKLTFPTYSEQYIHFYDILSSQSHVQSYITILNNLSSSKIYNIWTAFSCLAPQVVLPNCNQNDGSLYM